jgi:hypothetical protein
MVGFDEYDRKARLTPGLLAITPVAVLVVVLGWRDYPAVASLSAILLASGAAYLLAVMVRYVGRRIEPELWESWGGAPTTRLLRTRSATDNALLRDNRRRAVEAYTGIKLLDPAEELADPTRADQTIQTAISQVIHLGQNADYRLLAQENVNYGFERNFFAFRWVGRTVAVLCLAGLALLLYLNHVDAGGQRLSVGALVGGVVIEAVFLLGWLLLPSASRTRAAAERYAERLLQAVVVEARRTGGTQ